MIEVGILDDEPISAEYLKSVLQKIEDVNVVGCFSNEMLAMQQFEKKLPELIFIDINMPLLNGFRFLEELQSKTKKLPLVVFVSAHTEFALNAFQIKAVDYVLKPFSHDRIFEALKRARLILAYPSLKAMPLINKEGHEVAKKLTELSADHRASVDLQSSKLVVKDSGSRIIIDLENIIWVESEGDYVRLSDKKHVYFMRGTLKSMEEKLEGYGFVKIHRSRIVKLNNIQKFNFSSNSDNLVEMSDGTLFTVSRSYKTDLRKKIEAS